MKTQINTPYGTLELSSSGRFTGLFGDSQKDSLEKIKRRCVEAFERFDKNSGETIRHIHPRIYSVDGKHLYYRLKGAEAVRVERDRVQNTLIFHGGETGEKGHEGEQKSFKVPLDETIPVALIKPVDLDVVIIWEKPSKLSSRSYYTGRIKGVHIYTVKNTGTKKWSLTNFAEARDMGMHPSLNAAKDAAQRDILLQLQKKPQPKMKWVRKPADVPQLNKMYKYVLYINAQLVFTVKRAQTGMIWLPQPEGPIEQDHLAGCKSLTEAKTAALDFCKQQGLV
jgi:hypothetical protein